MVNFKEMSLRRIVGKTLNVESTYISMREAELEAFKTDEVSVGMAELLTSDWSMVLQDGSNVF